jgi:Domain of unknown function (DUF4170)
MICCPGHILPTCTVSLDQSHANDQNGELSPLRHGTKELQMAGSLLSSSTSGKAPKQLLHLVFGGELTSLDGLDFRNLKDLDIVGIFPNYDEAHKAWKGAAQRTVDNAHMRYFIVHMHRLLDPDAKI